MGELSKLLLGREPRQALRLARDTGVLVELLPEFVKAVGFDQESLYHDLTVDEHTFAVVQAAADAGMPLRVRLATLFHDLGNRMSRGAEATGACISTRGTDVATTPRSARNSPTMRCDGCATRTSCARASSGSSASTCSTSGRR